MDEVLRLELPSVEKLLGLLIDIDGFPIGGIIQPQGKSGKTAIRRSKRGELANHLSVEEHSRWKEKRVTGCKPSQYSGEMHLPTSMDAVHRLAAERRLGVERPIR